MLLNIHNRICAGMAAVILTALLFPAVVLALPVDKASTDRIAAVTRQIKLLQDRYRQSEIELGSLRSANLDLPNATLELASVNLLDKAALDISVAKSNLESINIELADVKQTVTLLDKNIQEIRNQLNLLSIFGNRIARDEHMNASQLQSDLDYQGRLLSLEKERMKYLTDLQDTAKSILQLRKDQLVKLNSILKSQRLLRLRQQEVRDELAYQEQQNQWLQRLNVLYDKLDKANPAESRAEYADLEAQIFAANEHANYSYTQSLIARYRDQIRQLRAAALKGSSIGQLNELSVQHDLLSRQISKLRSVITSRINILKNHVSMMPQKKGAPDQDNNTQNDLRNLLKNYQTSDVTLKILDEKLGAFHSTLDKALQVELSSRQGLPSFDSRSMIDIGKEMLLVPALAFQVVKNLIVSLAKNVRSASALTWSIYLLSQFVLAFAFIFTNRLTQYLINKPSDWRERINSKWISLKWLDHHFIDLYLMLNVLVTMSIFMVPVDYYIFFIYLFGVWFLFKSIIMIARICLVETMNHTAGKDMRLYKRLMWIFLVGGIFTAAAVFIYQLPLIYELKTLADRVFLLFMMVVSIMLLRFWDVVPNLILSHMEERHPYFEKIIRVIGIVVPSLMFANSAIGLLGYLNLVMTVSWYEGVFLIVFVSYLILRGLLTDGVEQISRVVIQHSSNGWLLSEAFLKPLDRILRVSLFLAAGSLLFLFYGWDHQSPIVERLNGLLHYQLANVLNTTITPIRMLGVFVVMSVFYWTAKWTREFVYRALASRTTDMGIRNSVAILSQYSMIVLGAFVCLQVLGIDLRALAFVTGMLAFGVGLGLRDLANNFFCGFLILLERPLRVGDIIAVNDIEGEVINIGSRAVTVMTWDHTALVVPNIEIFNKTFTNLTARDNILRCVVKIKISRHDNPHQIQAIILQVMRESPAILTNPEPEVFLKEMNDLLLGFELRYYVNVRQIKSRTMVMSELLMAIWDAFERNGIKPPYPQQEIFIRSEQYTAERLLSIDNPEHPEIMQNS
ncbi:MAG TPA: mechanosensitive ion channel domain-containing protein [Gammaproteobacteria bacterium]|nr:mechanosensitive ion channel domain-containing protein [Gammaproteobacteria bacterium]